ncbi:MAG: peptidoglycan-binding domain-containing protein, partial [Ilumatobacteraceae bacterium]
MSSPNYTPRSNTRTLGVSAALVMAVMVVVAVVVEQRADDEPARQVVATTSTSTTAAKVLLPPITRNLAEGVEGEDVRNLQVRLAELKFAPGPIDGIYGRATVQAVWAFEILVRQVPREDETG